VIDSRERLMEVIKILQKDLPLLDVDYKYLFKRYLNLDKYPLAAKYIVIIEELVTDAI
jgi:hypothetical protein